MSSILQAREEGEWSCALLLHKACLADTSAVACSHPAMKSLQYSLDSYMLPCKQLILPWVSREGNASTAQPWQFHARLWLISIAFNLQGIVTHVTDVKPLIKVATYLDEESGVEVYQEVTGVRPPLPLQQCLDGLALMHSWPKALLDILREDLSL